MRHLIEKLEKATGAEKSTVKKSDVERMLRSKGWEDGNKTGRKYDNVYVYGGTPAAFFLFRGDELVGAVKDPEYKGDYHQIDLLYFEGEKVPQVYTFDEEGLKMSDFSPGNFKVRPKPVKDLPKAEE